MKLFCSLIFLFFSIGLYSQNIKIAHQENLEWNLGKEGQALQIKFYPEGLDTIKSTSFSIVQGKMLGMNIDTTGNFSWNPGFNLISRNEEKKIFQFQIEMLINNEFRATKTIDLIISHTNRPVVHQILPTFYLKFNTKNTYKIDPLLVYDEDDDQIVFIPNLDTFPEGLSLSSNGLFTWDPSFSQYKKLKEEAKFIEFFAQDQPAKTSSSIKLKIEATQLDLAPTITQIPNKDKIFVKENENLNLRFYLSDPNGEEDIETFDFISNLPNFDKKALVKNANNQYEFIWKPDYSFVQDPTDTLGFYLDFFVLDKSQKRDAKRVFVNVKNMVNEAELDKKNYQLYEGTVKKAWELLEQLKEKEEELKKSYTRARKGKKQRSVVNASLGATTGLSSIFTKGKPDTQRMISSIGGTTVLTISTLEATEVIGKSMKDLIDRLNYVIEKKNEIQTKGDIFARDFSLKSNRRNTDFIRKTDDFMNTMNLKGLVALELNATWETKKKPTVENISKSFKDFANW